MLSSSVSNVFVAILKYRKIIKRKKMFLWPGSVCAVDVRLFSQYRREHCEQLFMVFHDLVMNQILAVYISFLTDRNRQKKNPTSLCLNSSETSIWNIYLTAFCLSQSLIHVSWIDGQAKKKTPKTVKYLNTIDFSDLSELNTLISVKKYINGQSWLSTSVSDSIWW